MELLLLELNCKNGIDPGSDVICDVIERRAVVFRRLTCSTFDDVTDDVILPLGWGGSIFLGESQSRIYPNMCAKFGCGPTVVSKKKGGRETQTDRQTDKGTLQLYIVDNNNTAPCLTHSSKQHVHL